MKKSLFFVTLTLLFNCSFGQFKILSNYTAEMTNGALTFKTSNPGVEIGANDNQGVYQTFISFYHSVSNWNKVKAYSYSVVSDSILKTNITPIQNASEILNSINTYSYTMKDNEEEVEYGVLAQELESIIPSLVDSAHGVRGVNYTGLIPFLISGFQEKDKALNDLNDEIIQLREENDWLREQVEVLLATMNGEKNSNNSKSQYSTNENTSGCPVLYQNNPNPFSQETRIHCFIPETSNNASLIIYNLQGQELANYSLMQKGEQDCVIQGSELMAGMYVYTLIVDNQIVDSKRMILTK
jgi:hypothetical protein